MIDNQQGDAFHFRRRGESQHGLAAAMRSQPLEGPALVGDFAFRVDNLQQSFVSLRRGVGTALRFLDDLAASSAAPAYPSQETAVADDEAAALTTDRRRWRRGYSYSSASTSEPRTADSAGQSAARNAAASITGMTASATPIGNW